MEANEFTETLLQYLSGTARRLARTPPPPAYRKPRRLAAPALLALLAVLAAGPAAAQTSITQTGGGATWTLTGHTSVAAGGKYTFTITLESGTKPLGEYAGFYLPDTADNQDKLGTAPNNCTSPKQFCISFSGRPPNGIFDNLGGHDTRWALLSSTSPHTLTATFAVAADAPDGSTIEFGALDTDGVPRGDGLTITTTTLVSNTGQNNSLTARVESLELAQAFGTGSHTAGYDLASIVLSLGSAPTGTGTLTVTVREDASGDPSGTALYTLTTPDPIAGDALNTFPAPAGATLDADSTYWVVASYSADSGGLNWWRTLLSNGIDSGGATGWTIDSPFKRDSRTAPDGWEVGSTSRGLQLQVKGTAKGGPTTTDTPVTIEAEHESIGAGLEDLVFTLTREGATTDVLSAKVTIVQAQSWLGTLEYDVTFPANSTTAELTITASNFSFTPSTTGDLSATVSGDGIDGGSDTVAVISTSGPPITISYDMSAYTFAENATDAAVYLVATLDAAYPRGPSRNYSVTFSTTPGTAEDPEDYATLSERETFTRGEYGRTAETDPFVARKLLSDFGFAIEDDAIYEGSERFGLIIEPDLTHVVGMAVFQKPDGTTCEPFGDCLNSPFEYPVTITDEGDLPALLLSVDPSSIAEEDDDGTTGTAEHVSTVTVEITNGKTFAVDQTVTLTFSGTATQGTHYSVTPGDADTNTAGHQVVLRTGDSSVEVTVTATGNDTADRNRTVTVAADLDGTAIGSTDITILDDEDTNDATLSALALSGVTLAPTFVSSTETYTATVGNAVTETTVTATPTHSGATVAFKDGADNALTNPVTLAEGANVIKAVVTAADTTTMKTYMVTVTRAATAPAIVTGGVRATSMPLVGDTYGLGETIKITVTFDKAVTVDTSGGKPRIRSVLNGGGTPVDGWAEYSSGSGGTALVFTYTVQAGDMDDDGIWLPANSLELQGGTIRDAADTTVDATLTYAQPGTQSEHKVDGGPTLSDDATLSALALSGVTLRPDLRIGHGGLHRNGGERRHGDHGDGDPDAFGRDGRLQGRRRQCAHQPGDPCRGRQRHQGGGDGRGHNHHEDLHGDGDAGGHHQHLPYPQPRRPDADLDRDGDGGSLRGRGNCVSVWIWAGFWGTGRHPIQCRHERLHRGPRAVACERVDSRRTS